MDPQKYVSGGIVFSLILIFLLLIDWVVIPMIFFTEKAAFHGTFVHVFFSDPAGDHEPPYNGINLAIIFILAALITFIVTRLEKR